MPLPANERWIYWLAGGAVLVLVLLLAVGDAPLRWPWIPVWAAGTVPLAVGLWDGWRARAAARAFPFAPGSYLFATDLVQVMEGKCRLFSLDEIVGVQPAATVDRKGVSHAAIRFTLPTGSVNLPVVSKAAALRLIENFCAAREAIAAAMAAGDWDQVYAHDPLYEVRFGGQWEELAPVRHAAFWNAGGLPDLQPRLGPALGWGAAAGIVAALGLWWGSNVVRDNLAFGRAKAANNVKAWQKYLDLGSVRHRGEVTMRWLPIAALEAAKKEGALAALREVVASYPGTAAANEAQDLLRTRLNESTARAAVGTPPEAARALTSLLRWLGDHASSVLEVRFGQTMQSTPAEFERAWQSMDAALTLRGAKAEMARIKEHFDKDTLRIRENRMIANLGTGLDRQLGENVIYLRRGEAFSGEPVGFDSPALAIEWTAALSPNALTESRFVAESIYLPMTFHFSATLMVPGAQSYGWEFDINPLPGLEESASVKGLYGRMFDAAFEEFDQRLAASFFPNHAPPRKEVLAPASKTTSTSAPRQQPAPTARQPQLAANGTAFFISPFGHIVTAYHCVQDAGAIKIVRKGAPPLEATLEKADPANDLAILKVRGTTVSDYLPIRPSRDVRQGESVATLGYPNIRQQGREAKLSRGDISSLTGMRDEPNEFQISVPLQPGNSGGPLFDLRGNIVGVVVSSMRNAQVVNYAVKSSILLSILEAVPELATLPPPQTGEIPKFEDMIERVSKATALLEIYEK